MNNEPDEDITIDLTDILDIMEELDLTEEDVLKDIGPMEE